jgi:hypothetical protein
VVSLVRRGNHLSLSAGPTPFRREALGRYSGAIFKNGDEMAHNEACQLFIEQQIKEGLDEGKTPYSGTYGDDREDV